MLDVKLLRDNLNEVKQRIATRGVVIDWDEFVSLDRERREALAHIERLKEKKNRLSGEIGKLTRTSIEFTLSNSTMPANAAVEAQQAIERVAGRLGLTHRRLPSGAVHDAQMMARLSPMGMIFVPSIGGISHSPLERTSWEDCARGAQVLLDTVLDLDARPGASPG